MPQLRWPMARTGYCDTPTYFGLNALLWKIIWGTVHPKWLGIVHMCVMTTCTCVYGNLSKYVMRQCTNKKNIIDTNNNNNNNINGGGNDDNDNYMIITWPFHSIHVIHVYSINIVWVSSIIFFKIYNVARN